MYIIRHVPLSPPFLTDSTLLIKIIKLEPSSFSTRKKDKLGSVAGPVIQANGRLTFEDDLRSGGLLCFISMNACVRTELADSMVTLGEPGDD